MKFTPRVTGVYFDRDETMQYRFEASAMLIDSSVAEEKHFYETTWGKIRPDLRNKLWQEFLGDGQADYDIDQVCPCHGIVILKPYYWDIFKLNSVDFSASERTQIVLKNNKWIVYENTPIVRPLELLD